MGTKPVAPASTLYTVRMHSRILALFLVAALFVPAPASADTLSDLFARLSALQVKLRALQTAATVTPTASACPVISRALSRGSRGEDVASLQRFLIAQNLLAADSATGFYGALTERAVQEWQARYNVVSSGTPATTGYGSIGPKTRALMARSCAVAPDLAPSTGTSTPPITYRAAPSSSAPQSASNPPGASVPPPSVGGASCSLDGVTVPHGSSRTFYALSSVVEGTSCSSFVQTRTCSNGTLSGDAAFAHVACSATPTKVGANYHLYKACFGPGGSHIGTQPQFLLSDYQKPGVREQAKTQLASMRGGGIETLRTMIFFASYPTQPVTGVINIDDATSRANLLASVDQYVSDAKAAGFRQLTVSFNPMGPNSPLDYVRAWLVSSGQPTPGFDPAYIQTNLELIGQVRAKAKAHESADFKVVLDLLNEANTTLISADADARDYLPEFWKRYVDAYGSDDASFAVNFVGADSRRDTAAFVAALKRSERTLPPFFMFHFYDDPSMGNSYADLSNLSATFERAGVPADRRKIQIAEAFYEHTKTAADIWNAIRQSGLQIAEVLEWPWRPEDTPSKNNACAQHAPQPYRAEAYAGILKNGPSGTNSDVVWASYNAPGMGILVKKGTGAARALFISTYDENGAPLRSMVPYANVNQNTNVYGFPSSALEHKTLASGSISVRLWESDGTQSATFTVGPCGGASYGSCGGLGDTPVGIVSAGYVASNGALWVRFRAPGGAWPARVDLYDSEYNLLRSVTEYRQESAGADFSQLSFAANAREQVSLAWRQYGGGRDVRVRVVMPDGSSSQLYQLTDL